MILILKIVFKEFLLMNLKVQEVASYTKENGTKKLEKEMEWVFNFGRMDQNMKVAGEMIKRMEKEE